MRHVLIFSLLLILIVFDWAVVSGMVIRVPGNQPTIQSGIEAAADGDTVLVADGTFAGDGNRDIDPLGKAITLMSESGYQSCVIDCEGSESEPHRGFVVYNWETQSTIIHGFTVENGFSQYGAAILIDSASPYLIDCRVVSASDADSGGGAIFCKSSHGMIKDCFIQDNNSSGIRSFASSTTIQNCVITGNENNGIELTAFSENLVKDCIISDNGNESIDGGGIGCWGVFSVEISGSEILNNQGRGGGGIYSINDTESLTIDNCNISGNMAWQDGGGGILYFSGMQITVTKCQIVNNYTDTWGGGIESGYEGTVILTENTIEGNLAQRTGGGIWMTSEAITIIGGDPLSGNTFLDNRAGAGADIYCQRESPALITATYNTFSGYHLSDYFVEPQESFDLSDCVSEMIPVTQDVFVSPSGDDSNDGLTLDTPFQTIDHAMSRIYGTEPDPVTVHIAPGTYSPSENGERFPVNMHDHVILSGEDPNTTILEADDSTSLVYAVYDDDINISGLTATGAQKSGIYCYESTVSIHNSVITGSQSKAGIFLDYTEMSLSNCSISSNESYGIHGFQGNHLTISDCLISGNSLRGIYFHDDDTQYLTITGSEISGNGGGIYCQYTDVDISHCLITLNETEDKGGGIRVLHSHLQVTNSEIMDNATIRSGGGIYSSGADLADCIISNCTIRGNYSGLDGGGIRSGDLYIYYTEIIDNIAMQRGGGISTSSNNQLFASCTFDNNSAESGSALSFYHSKGATITNCLFLNNNSSLEGGAIYYQQQSETETINCTFYGNHSSGSGGAIYNGRLCTTELFNNIFYENTAPNGPEIWIGTDENPSYLTIDYSNLQGGQSSVHVEPGCTLTWGDHMIETDPLFTSGPYGDYYLSHTDAGQEEDSPCIDTGSDLAENICFETQNQLPPYLRWGGQPARPKQGYRVTRVEAAIAKVRGEGPICLDTLTTRTDLVTDTGQVDMGFHYPPDYPPCLNTGDVDGNGYVTAGDARTTFLIALAYYDPTYLEECAADCNADSYVTSGDAQDIFLASLGMGECVDPMSSPKAAVPPVVSP